MECIEIFDSDEDMETEKLNEKKQVLIENPEKEQNFRDKVTLSAFPLKEIEKGKIDIDRGNLNVDIKNSDEEIKIAEASNFSDLIPKSYFKDDIEKIKDFLLDFEIEDHENEFEKVNENTVNAEINKQSDESDCEKAKNNEDSDGNHTSDETNLADRVYYECSFCGKTFIKSADLDKHIPSHTGKKAYNCMFCKKAYTKREHLTYHQKHKHVTTARRPCTFCGSFIQRETLNKHILDHFKSQPSFECKLCRKKYDNENNLIKHVSAKHNNIRNTCKVCNKEFNSQKLLFQHKSEHWRSIYTCSVCNKTFSNKLLIMKHVNSEHDNLPKEPYMCGICLQKFSECNELVLHKFSHTESSKLVCSHCKLIFSTESALNGHIQAKHLGKAQHKCTNCFKVFSLDIWLKRHLNFFCKGKSVYKSTSKADLVFLSHVCPGCKQSFQIEEDLDVHIRQNHVGELLYKCEKCDVCFTLGRALKRHILFHTEENNTLFPNEKLNTIKTNSPHSKETINNMFVPENNQTHVREELFSCPVCLEKFSTKEQITEHIQKHNSGTYTCKICDIRFQFDKTSLNHVKMHITNTFECRFCEKSFGDKILFQTHMLIHNETLYECSHCGKKWANENALKTRLRGNTKDFACTNCDKKFAEKSGLGTNLEDMFSCRICKVTFGSKGGLNKHMYNHNSNSPLACHQCMRLFEDLRCLNRHNIKFHNFKKPIQKNAKEFPYKCPVCVTRFSRKESLTKHRLVHKQEKSTINSNTSYNCSICDRTYSSELSIKKHLLVHKNVKTTNDSRILRQTSNNKNYFKCEICCKKFTRKFDMINHKRLHDSECPICKKLFAGKHTMRKHTLTHSVNKSNSHKCKICNKLYSSRSNLLRHIKVHKKDPPEKECPICYKTFLRQDDFSSHVLLHDMTQIHICTICSKLFSTEDQLNNHILVHKHKPYKCKICKKDYAIRNSLIRHMHVHKKKNPSNSGNPSKPTKTPRKKFRCTFCKNLYKSSYDLRIHQAIHLESYQCDIVGCHIVFYKKEYLDQHMLNHPQQLLHPKSNGRTYSLACPICLRTSDFPARLQRHMTTHDNEKLPLAT